MIAFAAMGLSFCVCAAAEKNIRENLSYILFTRNFFKFAAAFAVGFAAVFAAFYSSFGANWGGIADAGEIVLALFGEVGFGRARLGLRVLPATADAPKVGGRGLRRAADCDTRPRGNRLCDSPQKKIGVEVRVRNVRVLQRGVRCSHSEPYKIQNAVASALARHVPLRGGGLRRGVAAFDEKRLGAGLAAFAAVAALAFWQYKLSANASERYASDPRNPFIYSHTVRDFSNLEKRIREAAKFSEYKNDIPVAFVMRESPWPAPFDLRDLRNTGFWSGGKIPENLPIFDVVVCDGASEDALSAALPPEKYAREFYGLRKNLVLTAFIKKDIFEKIVNQDAK